MKFKIFKLFIPLCALCALLGLVACSGGENPENSKTALATPEISIADNVISWAAVENADLYEIFEGETQVARQAQTVYAVRKTLPGEYSYAVRAVSASGEYAPSALSEKVTFVLTQAAAAQKLAVPQVDFDPQTQTLSWGTVENATGYAVFENGVLAGSTQLTQYVVQPPKRGQYEYRVSATSDNPAYITGDQSREIIYDCPAVPVAAPQIAYDGGSKTISWQKVEHSSGYEVYEGIRRVAVVETCAYTVTQTEYGDFEYWVRAVPENEDYDFSAFSNKVTVTLMAPNGRLASPQIVIEGKVISWDAVENATGYKIYENGVYYADAEGLSFEITRRTPGVYAYTVSAVPGSRDYMESLPSSAVEYTVSQDTIKYTVTVVFPDEYSGEESVEAALYKNGEIVDSATGEKDGGGRATVELWAVADDYAIKLVNSPAGYLSTQGAVTPDKNEGVIRLVPDNGKVFAVGTNTFKVETLGPDDSNEQVYAFIAERGGIYSVDLRGESKNVVVFVNTSIVADSEQGMEIGQFYAETGEVLEMVVAASARGDYSFEIAEGEIKQDLKVGNGDTEQRGGANFISQGVRSCTRYLTLTERTELTFMFTTATIGLQKVTVEIEGRQYVFDGDLFCTQNIIVNAGEDIRVTFSVEGENGRDEGAIAFFVYPAR